MKKTPDEIEKMRVAGRITAQILREMTEATKPGVTPVELDALAGRRCQELGAIPAFKGYKGFPANVCISTNNEVVHTIPGTRPFKSGDLVKLDFGVSVNGYFGDAAVTIPLKPVKEIHQRLKDTVDRALAASLLMLEPGKLLNSLGYTIQTLVERQGFIVLRGLCGHGIGTALHEEPPVLNFGSPGRSVVIEEGMIFAIEPIIAIGSGELELLEDHWTLRTTDGGYSAHAEHTVLVTKNGPEILTKE